MKFKYITLIGLLAFTLSSCSDFLDVQPEGDPTTDQYFSNDGQAIDIVDGLYARLPQEGVFGRELFWEQGAACDIVWGRTRGYNTLATFNYTGDESPLRETFGYFYKIMSRANFVVNGLLNKQKDTKLSKIETRSLGEAYFIRAFTHFYISYRYGTDKQGVPFVRYEDYPNGYDNSIPKQQASVIDNYKYIIEDLDKAIALLPRYEDYSDEDKGRTHQAAAVGLKAKTYAYWAIWDDSQWQNVIKMVDMLESKYGRNLTPTFAKNFSSEIADFWNSEYIYSFPSNGGSGGGGVEFPGVILENKGWGKMNGWGQIKPSYDIYEEMAKDGAGNDRLVRSILEYGQKFQYFGEEMEFYAAQDLESGFQINKYMDPFKHEDPIGKGYINPNKNWPTVRINFPVMRFAEMLLFRAEAYLMTGNASKATEDLNRIRVRSNLAKLQGTATMADLYHERRCELAFEYTDHLFDLKRWHHSSNAEIKALAAKELNAHPRVRNYVNRSDPKSTFTIGDYADYQDKKTYEDYMIVFPYPSQEITKSNGKLKQNAGY